ncbi:MAG: aminotransferase class III-fold pyridoxal phosphate-dependent enzyme, partial [Candidatus Heimdallarchaeota archaeon]|nr:aminotransferase class III-fold pyridoxal phosphate-dependent enzyme [Candidatus Heimdallarchaeota archaeon]
MFASEYWNLQPDIFAIAKGMASGMPIAGTTVVPKVADAVELGDFFSTFGGNPVCSAVALENIKILEEDNLIENAEKIGKLFFDELENTQKKFEIIGDVRGKGLMIGIELVKDRSTKTPAKEAVDKIGKYLQKEGILIGQGGFYGNVLRLQPPLVITEDQANRVMSKLNAALAAL